MDARALFGLSAEACLGQMVRGGRSWPSDWKAGMRAESAGKMTEEVRLGSSSEGTAPTMDAMQQPLAQKWHVAGWSSDDVSEFGASSLA